MQTNKKICLDNKNQCQLKTIAWTQIKALTFRNFEVNANNIGVVTGLNWENLKEISLSIYLLYLQRARILGIKVRNY